MDAQRRRTTIKSAHHYFISSLVVDQILEKKNSKTKSETKEDYVVYIINSLGLNWELYLFIHRYSIKHCIILLVYIIIITSESKSFMVNKNVSSPENVFLRQHQDWLSFLR